MPSEDLVVTPIDVKIPIGGKVDVQCSNPSPSNTSSQNQLPLITDSFVTLQLVSTYRISANSFRGNYSFLNLALFTVTFDQKVSKKNSFRGNYSRKYGKCMLEGKTS